MSSRRKCGEKWNGDRGGGERKVKRGRAGKRSVGKRSENGLGRAAEKGNLTLPLTQSTSVDKRKPNYNSIPVSIFNFHSILSLLRLRILSFLFRLPHGVLLLDGASPPSSPFCATKKFGSLARHRHCRSEKCDCTAN